jgi:hypothetical protein
MQRILASAMVDSASSTTKNDGGSNMSSNFLISLRNDAGLGIPGTEIGPAAYIAIQEKEKLYDLKLKMDSSVWLESIRKSGASSVLVFVHGFADDALKVVARHNSIKPHLPPSVALVSFDWPAGNPGGPEEKYEKDKANAKQTAGQLIRDCLQPLLDRLGSGNVNLFAHSMGAYVTETAFFSVPNASTMKINHVLMAAADVDQLNYVDKSPSLKNFLNKCTDLTVYWSSDDAALQDSEKLNKYTPLGLKGYPDPDTPGGCYGVQCTTYYNRYVKYSGQDATFSHIWYILYPVIPPQPPSVNDFYTDMIKTLQGPPVPPPPSPSPTRATGFMLRRPN